MANLLVLYNPVCGDRSAQSVFEKQVIPLLQEKGKTPDQVVATTHAGHAGELVVKYLQQHPEPLTLILGSGDGTLHEIVVALYNASFSKPIEIAVVLVPSGTANALYWSLFPPVPADPQDSSSPKSPSKALDAYLSSSPTHRPLTFAVTTFYPQANAPSQTVESVKTSVATVVASTSLHASILHDSEALRATHPGIERFKIAAQQNITRWYKGSVKLHPAPDQKSVELYQARQKRFEPWADEGVVTLEGPFAYFLSTVNVDRLESAFRITPFHSPGSSGPTLDVVVIRPRRDKSIVDNSESSKNAFANKTSEVLMAAYKDGAHVDILYDESAGSESVAEYFRCSRWEWIPEPDDSAAHLVCVDGEIIEVGPAGKADCTATREISNVHVSVIA